MSDRLPPHDTEAEQALLGCILEDSVKCLPECVEKLAGADCFYDLRCRNIYEILLAMSEENTPIDMVTVSGWAKDKGDIRLVGGQEYLSSLPGAVLSTANLSAYIDRLNGQLTLRRIISACTSLVGRAYGGADPTEILDAAETEILAIRGDKTSGTPGIKELVKESLSHIEDVYSRQGALGGIPTGLTDLDRLTDGLHDGEMTVLVGYPGSGKTSLGMNLAEHAMLEEGKRVAVFSMEMSARLLVTRFLCSHARVNLRGLSKGFLAERDFGRIAASALKISNSAIWFDDEPALSVARLRAKARRLWQQHKVQLVVIDYLQLMNAAGGSRKVENQAQEYSEISKGLKAMSRELNLPVIVLSQLNDDGRILGSRAPGQDGDNVWCLDLDSEKAESEDPAVPVTLTIRKQRNGPRGKVPLVFLRQFTRFESAARVSETEQATGQPYPD